MLPLDSPPWNSFHTFFGSAAQVPQRIATWRASIGGPNEDSQWTDLWEQFLHQYTITDAAYAAVPHVVAELPRIPSRKRFDYLLEVGLIESARQQVGAPELAIDLADAYHKAIGRARALAVECLSLDWPKIEFRYLLCILSSLHGHGGLGELLFHLDCLCGECSKCGECVYPDDIQISGYVK
jgi:hypothetical protein